MDHPLIGFVDAPRDERFICLPALGASIRARMSGHDLLLTHGLNETPLDCLSGLIVNDAKDASLLMPTIENWVASAGGKAVSLNIESEVVPSSLIDFQQGMSSAVRHLKDLGHEKIAFLNADTNNPLALNRRLAFKIALEEHGLEYDPSKDLPGEWNAINGDKRMRLLLQSGSACTAVICCNDRLAIGCIHAAKRFGLRVPEELAVIGCGNFSQILNSCDHPLSSITFPIYSNGFDAANTVIELIAHDRNVPANTRVPTQLAKRQTTLGKKYVKPTLERAFSRSNSLFDFILSVGGSISPTRRKELVADFLRKSENHDNAFKAFLEFMLKSVEYGLDALVAHRLILSVGHDWSVWSREFSSSVSHQQIIDSLYSELSDNGMYLNRFTEHLSEQLNSRLVQFRNSVTHDPNESALSFELQNLCDFLQSRCFYIALFDKQAKCVGDLGGEAVLMEYSTSHEPEVKQVVADFSSLIEQVLGNQSFPLAIEAIPLARNGDIFGIAILDLDSPYSLFNVDIAAELQITPALSGDRAYLTHPNLA